MFRNTTVRAAKTRPTLHDHKPSNVYKHKLKQAHSQHSHNADVTFSKCSCLTPFLGFGFKILKSNTVKHLSKYSLH